MLKCCLPGIFRANNFFDRLYVESKSKRNKYVGALWSLIRDEITWCAGCAKHRSVIICYVEYVYWMNVKTEFVKSRARGGSVDKTRMEEMIWKTFWYNYHQISKYCFNAQIQESEVEFFHIFRDFSTLSIIHFYTELIVR